MLCNGILLYFYLLSLYFYNNQRERKKKNLKHKTKLYQTKLEF